MKLIGILRFEVAYQLRRLRPWLSLLAHARKVVADSAGVETEVPLDESVQIGVFGAHERDELGNPLYVRMHRSRAGEQTITVRVPRDPVLAGVAPYHMLDWVEKANDDNIDSVSIKR